MFKHILTSFVILSSVACNPNRRTPETFELNPCPEFSADSAYSFIEKQVSYGYRIPGTEGHEMCGRFLIKTLERFGLSVSEQVDSVIGYDQQKLPLRNIMAQLNPHHSKRLLLCAHWDSRPFADQQKDEVNVPIVGANDNASGVGVILEIVRILSIKNPNVGVDFVLFDLEDQGRPATTEEIDRYDHGFCLGSQYWCVLNKKTEYELGIMLSMVGSKDATFNLEGYSMEYAPQQTHKVWDMANQLGFGKYFKYNRTHPVYESHSRINYMTNTPCVGIVDQDVFRKNLYPGYWHTHNDNMQVIDRNTLYAVGQTVTQLVYNSEHGK